MAKYETYTTPEEQENYVNFCIHYEQNKSDLDACNKNVIQATKLIQQKNDEIATLNKTQANLKEKLQENLLAQKTLEQDKKTLETQYQQLDQLQKEKDTQLNELQQQLNQLQEEKDTQSAELIKLQSEFEAKEKNYNNN